MLTTKDLFSRCHSVVADSLSGVQALSREFRAQFVETQQGVAWSVVLPLSAHIRDGARRAPEADLSLFKGMGLSDLTLGSLLLESAHAGGADRPIPTARKVAPRFTNSPAPSRS